MNEASNFCTGACYQDQVPDFPVKNSLTYYPTGRDLETKAISLDAIHSNGFTQLDTHSLFGTMEVKATHDWFESQNSRAMIIERSAFAGLGKYGSRWLGDNFSNEKYMGYSVTGIMSHHIAGIPLAGSDICGFIGNTNPELCARWYNVGAFYPFSRNHNSWDTVAQEPYRFINDIYESNISYFDIIKHAMKTKLQFIRYFYTRSGHVNRNGGSFYKPLFFEFPDDPLVYVDQPLNIMLGEAAKLSIQSTTLGQDQTDFIFPAGTWCNLFNQNGTNGCVTYA